MEKKAKREISIPNYSLGEELFNSISHGLGAVLSIAALVLMLIRARGALAVTCVCLFGAAMILLYTMSCLYHSLSPKLRGKKVLRVLDHCNVFLLVLGTYIPVALLGVGGARGWVLFAVVCCFTVLGIVFTAIDLKTFRIPSMVCYLAMGWLILFCMRPTVRAIGLGGLILLVAGGLCYTAGAVLYMNGKRRRYIHSVFHLFVLAGSLLHFLCILFYVM